MLAPKDTTPRASEQQVRRLRSMGPEERLRRSLEMSDDLREIAEAGIRARHPGYAEQEVREELEVLVLGSGLTSAFRRARLIPGL